MRQFSLGRRRFSLGVAAAAASALVPPLKAYTQATSEHNPHSALSAAVAQETKAAMAKLSPRAQAEVEMRVAEIFRKHGASLSQEQKADIRKVMAETQEGLEKMRAFVLDNGDQPATVFHAYRAEGSR